MGMHGILPSDALGTRARLDRTQVFGKRGHRVVPKSIYGGVANAKSLQASTCNLCSAEHYTVDAGRRRPERSEYRDHSRGGFFRKTRSSKGNPSFRGGGEVAG